MHNVPKGAETHFRLVVVSQQFDRLDTLKRHRLINNILKDYFTELHALAIETYTPSQWSQMDFCSTLKSPNCRGGSKF
ncbi:hypothetical protein RDWZM_008600 [Blomia tropicalis]|uniref:Uncharacterized protein n=1 Tax=Blomia tropicalis TaxID=40697 RepID=A0A9Q0LZP3_BLOTA|nr:hypothetical protein RDWZM_008600 [Blomia tropicalis]